MFLWRRTWRDAEQGAGWWTGKSPVFTPHRWFWLTFWRVSTETPHVVSEAVCREVQVDPAWTQNWCEAVRGVTLCSACFTAACWITVLSPETPAHRQPLAAATVICVLYDESNCSSLYKWVAEGEKCSLEVLDFRLTRFWTGSFVTHTSLQSSAETSNRFRDVNSDCVTERLKKSSFKHELCHINTRLHIFVAEMLSARHCRHAQSRSAT